MTESNHVEIMKNYADEQHMIRNIITEDHSEGYYVINIIVI